MVVRTGMWIAGRLLRLLPEGLVGRLLPTAFRFTAADVPDPLVAPVGDVRLYVAPVNYAGQGWQWARAVEHHLPSAGAVDMVVRTGGDFRHPADREVPLGVYAASRSWQRAERAAVIEGFTHVLVEAEKQPFGALLDESVEAQVALLRDAGLGVIMVCHGSDIRLPSRHAAGEPDSPFLNSLWSLTPRLEREAAANAALLDRLGLPVLVSTPDLLLDVPSARWLPVVVDSDLWRSENEPLRRAVPVVVHAPSSGVVKGSDLIDPVLAALATEGLIEYRRIEKVPIAEMPAIYRDADIVVDQFRIGDYGVAACEAMAAGRVVIAHVSGHARSIVLAQAGVELPIVQSRAAELDGVIRSVLADREGYRAIAAAGPAFVAAVHDGRMSAGVLEPLLVEAGR